MAGRLPLSWRVLLAGLLFGVLGAVNTPAVRVPPAVVYGSISEQDAGAFVVDTAFNIHAFSGGASGGVLNNVTATTGSSVAISSVADAGGGSILVTTGAAHNLAVDDTVVLTGTTGYDGVYKVLTVPLGTTYTVTAVYGAPSTGTSTRPDFLTVDVTGARAIHWWITASADVANKAFWYGVYVNQAAVTQCTAAKKYGGTAGDIDTSAASCLYSFTATDDLWLYLNPRTDGTDLSDIRYGFEVVDP